MKYRMAPNYSYDDDANPLRLTDCDLQNISNY